MSLLLQALQKAAKNREDGATEGAVESGENAELSLEPVTEPEIGEEVTPDPTPSPAQAATVMRAAETPSYTALDWMRDHYMMTFIGGAVLFAIGYGLYVYIQISNPDFLRPAVPTAPSPLQTIAAPVVSETAASEKISGMPEEMGSIPERTQGTAKSTGTIAGTAGPAPEKASALASTPVDAGTGARNPAKLRRASDPKLKRADDASSAPAARNVSIEDDVEVIEIPPSPSIAAVSTRNATGEEISIRRQTSGVTPVAPDLLSAYEALQQGDYARSRALYADVLSSEPRNIDALLGMAAIAWKQGRAEEAGRHYSRVLDLDPRNAHAQAGLIAMLGIADPAAAESRLKQLIDREPTGFLYFTLGNLYAEQGLWPLAQNAYFQAAQFQPDNPDYAFNLAVGLEHLGKANLALDYYRKALDLSFKKGRANFDQNLAIQRVGQLSARVE